MLAITIRIYWWCFVVQNQNALNPAGPEPLAGFEDLYREGMPWEEGRGEGSKWSWAEGSGKRCERRRKGKGEGVRFKRTWTRPSVCRLFVVCNIRTALAFNFVTMQHIHLFYYILILHENSRILASKNLLVHRSSIRFFDLSFLGLDFFLVIKTGVYTLK